MSENIAGVTLLAFGNGSADIFASLANPLGDTSLMYSELFGAAVFVIGVIVGIIMIVKPFKVNYRTYIRDVTFFASSAITVSYFMDDKVYSVAEGCLTIIMYIGYISFVICDHIFVKKKLEERLSDANIPISIVNLNHRISKESSIISDKESIIENVLEQLSEMDTKIRNRKNPSIVLDENVNRVFDYDEQTNPNKGIFKKFFMSISPIEKDLWIESNYFQKILMLLKVYTSEIDCPHHIFFHNSIIFCFRCPLFSFYFLSSQSLTMEKHYMDGQNFSTVSISFFSLNGFFFFLVIQEHFFSISFPYQLLSF